MGTQKCKSKSFTIRSLQGAPLNRVFSIQRRTFCMLKKKGGDKV